MSREASIGSFALSAQPRRGKTIVEFDFQDISNSEGVTGLCHPFGIIKPETPNSQS
jgi:hypothetical protein